MLSEPKPCPFCGCSTVSAYAGSTYRWGFLACDNCGANKGDCRKVDPSLPPNDPVNLAGFIADWNDRDWGDRAAIEKEGAGLGAPRSDLEWLRLPEIFSKFVDYAERPVDENALRIIHAVTERASAPGAATPDVVEGEPR